MERTLFLKQTSAFPCFESRWSLHRRRTCLYIYDTIQLNQRLTLALLQVGRVFDARHFIIIETHLDRLIRFLVDEIQSTFPGVPTWWKYLSTDLLARGTLLSEVSQVMSP